jgi:hypothetical protein
MQATRIITALVKQAARRALAACAPYRVHVYSSTCAVATRTPCATHYAYTRRNALAWASMYGPAWLAVHIVHSGHVVAGRVVIR